MSIHLWCHVARAVFDQRGNEWRITNPKVCYLVPDQISQNMLSMSVFHKKVMTFIGDINLIQVLMIGAYRAFAYCVLYLHEG